MQIHIMDSDYEVMKELESLINSYPKTKAKCFTTHQQLVDAVREAPPDMVFVDIDPVNGLPAVRMIQAASPDTKVVILSKEKEKVSAFFELHTSGFLLKPIEEEKLKEQLFRVKHPMFSKIRYGGERTESV